MNDVFIALGSNLNDPLQQLMTAYNFLQRLCPLYKCTLSPVYQSAPLGPQDQPDFFNAVCRMRTGMSPLALLRQLQMQEQRQHREKTRPWGERTIDLDLLLFGDRIYSDETLTIPHPKFTSRLFVLMPLADIAANHRLPNNQTVQQALDHLCSKTIPAEYPQRLLETSNAF